MHRCIRRADHTRSTTCMHVQYRVTGLYHMSQRATRSMTLREHIQSNSNIAYVHAWTRHPHTCLNKAPRCLNQGSSTHPHTCLNKAPTPPTCPGSAQPKPSPDPAHPTHAQSPGPAKAQPRTQAHPRLSRDRPSPGPAQAQPMPSSGRGGGVGDECCNFEFQALQHVVNAYSA